MFSAHGWPNNVSKCDIFQNSILCEEAWHKIHKYISFHSPFCAQNRPYIALLDTCFFTSSPPIFFPNLCLIKFPKSLPNGSFEDPLGVCLFYDGTALSLSLLESALSLRRVIQSLSDFVWRNLLYLFFFVLLFSVLYIKNELNKGQFRINTTTFCDHITIFLKVE